MSGPQKEEISKWPTKPRPNGRSGLKRTDEVEMFYHISGTNPDP